MASKLEGGMPIQEASNIIKHEPYTPYSINYEEIWMRSLLSSKS